MSELNFLLSNYTAGDIGVLIVVCLLFVVVVLRAADFIWGKLKGYFDIKNDETKWQDKIADGIEKNHEELEKLHKSVDHLEEKGEERGRRLKKVEEYIAEDWQREQDILDHHKKIDEMCGRVQARLQDDTRWAFKDAYNFYYVKQGYIDSQSLEALEQKYQHYKLAGGNSFVDTIMKQMRTLPIKEYEVER